MKPRMHRLNRLGEPYFPQRPADRLLAFGLAALVPIVFVFLLAHFLWGIVVAALLFPVLPAWASDALVRFWSRVLLAALGIRLEVETYAGGWRAAGAPGALLLMNHVSWVDVFVVAAVVPARFVSKSEIRSWPIAGALAAGVGTLFIERGRRHAVAKVNEQVAERLRAGQSIGIFPEGTTTDGRQLLRFHANLLQAPVAAGAPIVPVTLQYVQDGAPSIAAAYIGDMNIAESVLRILVAPRLSVHLRVLPAISTEGATRHALARQAHEVVRRALALPDYEDAQAAGPGLDEETQASGP
jgi:1-acyl-sn-glycerol-3-phosphate acyltransferase